MFKTQVERLLLLGVLQIANYSEWGYPSFAQAKPKSNIVGFISDFSNINKQLKRNQYLMPKVDEMLLKLEGMQYDKSLDLNMVYYHIQLSKSASNLCTIILPWEKYHYKRLPMVIANSPEILQEKMNDLFHGFKFIPDYIEYLLVLTKEY